MTEASGRILLFGATGHTGRSAARILVAAGRRPVLVGREVGRLRALGAELGGGLPIEVADLTVPDSLGGGLIERGDVVVSAAGPFQRLGGPLLAAAAEAGAVYLDSSGEPPFVREAFERYGPRAVDTGAVLIPGCGYLHVAGTLAGSLAVEESLGRVGRDEPQDGVVARVDIAYFVGGGNLLPTATAGTLKSVAATVGRPGFTYRKGIVVVERPEVRDFEVGGRLRSAVAMGAVEHFTLPRTYPDLHSIEVYLGLLGPMTRMYGRVPPRLVDRATRATLWTMARVAARRTRHPVLTTRVVATAYDPTGLPLAEVHLSGCDPYVFTAGIMAWAAREAIEAGLTVTGAVGPVEAFGLGRLQVGCAEAGISRLSG
jgi:short subunit dehydrogenase-like uncharacterized protein